MTALDYVCKCGGGNYSTGFLDTGTRKNILRAQSIDKKEIYVELRKMKLSAVSRSLFAKMMLFLRYEYVILRLDNTEPHVDTASPPYDHGLLNHAQSSNEV